jgi:hypothetical protein
MYPNVKYELVEFERFIRSVAQAHEAQTGEINNRGLLDSVTREVDRVKQTFIHEVFNFGDERHLERYIQNHQQALIRLMDETVRLLATSKHRKREQYDICYKGLEELLAFVERHFARYFDQDAKAPEAYINLVRNDIRTNFNNLREGLLRKAANPRICDSTLYVLRKIMDEKPFHDITYRRVLYAKELQKELFTLMDRADPGKDINEELKNLIFYLNCNSVKSFAYHTHHIDELLNQAETKTEVIEKLSYLLKEINQAQVKPGIGYNVNVPTLKAQLNNYIIEEIEHLQRVHQFTNSSGARMPESVTPNFKINLDLSVAQVACLIRVFIEAKIIVNQNITELLKFLAKVLVSKKAESISYDSLRSKYYNVEQSTKEAVKRTLLKMISHIESST